MADGVGHNEGNCHLCNDRMQENREGDEEIYPFCICDTLKSHQCGCVIYELLRNSR